MENIESPNPSDRQEKIAPGYGEWKQIDKIPGWFFHESFLLWSALLKAQHAVKGNMFEIGVFRGKSAALLAHYLRQDESLFLIDPYMPVAEVAVNLGLPGGSHPQIQFWRMKSAQIASEAQYSKLRNSCRVIHIDGEHTAARIGQDLDIAQNLLNEMGMIIIDDFFNCAYPQITIRTIEFLKSESKGLILFLCAFNKGYICHAESYSKYIQFLVQEMIPFFQENNSPATLFKTSGISDSFTYGLRLRHESDKYSMIGHDFSQHFIEIPARASSQKL